MNAARPHFPAIQAAILASFAHRNQGNPCTCGAPPEKTIFRCKDCFKPSLYCRSCMVARHEESPFHRVEEWRGKHFSRVTWGLVEDQPAPVLQTCLRSHSSTMRCPQVTTTTTQSQNMTIVHHNGFHTFKFEFCSCSPGQGLALLPHWRQLLDVGLFPASYISPQTAFTWDVLKQFHIHCLTSKKSAYDYMKALCKLTNNAFAHDVKDRYREFQFAYRIWRYLALERRTGQAYHIDEYLSHRRKSSLTLRCPGCPEVGFNISKETMEAALESEQHKFTLYLSVDGNFKMQRKNKRDDPDDVALNAGNGYFVETEEYRRYLKLAKPTEDDVRTCSHLRAARMQNIAKFKNAVISGVVAVQCARHGFYLPQGMVDLKKGEAFANTDYVIVHSLAEASYLRWILFTYDIWCQYVIHFKDRIAQWFPTMLKILEFIRGAIPKMHIHNHIELCSILWNLNWLLYTAFTWGEMIETGWVEHNLTAGQTKEQNDGNRHDSVDDTSGSWNWDKMVDFANALLRSWRSCQLERRKRAANFQALTDKHPAELIERWEKADVISRMADGKLVSVFQTNFKKGPPTHADAYAKLLRAEYDAGASKETLTGDLGLITSALLVDVDTCHRHNVRRLVAKHAAEDLIAKSRQRLYQSVTDVRTRLVARAPMLEKHVVDADPEKPEKEALFLPSHFTESMRDELKLTTLAQVEYKLREGQAFDAIVETCTAIRTLNYNLTLKKTHIHGVGKNTRSQNFLRTLSNDVQTAADTYRRSRTALLALGLDEGNPALKPLLKTDLRGKSGRKAVMGDARTQDSWIWNTGRAADLTPEEEKEWEAELERVKWFRDRALRDRAIEEEQTLEQEFTRAVASFRQTSRIWTKLGEAATEAGAAAYAHKQSTMFEKLAVGVETAWEKSAELVSADFLAAEAKEAKEREETERLMREYRLSNPDAAEFEVRVRRMEWIKLTSAWQDYYETNEIFRP
ncbi:hypothetical protein C8R46DRAFT_893031 [Mycena filopes]|nr:hypothetical protein C8R46DRAFT_893031 [Mycena filopes]